MTAGLTPRMAECLAAIRKLTVGGVSPTIAEIMREIGAHSPSDVHRLLSDMRDRGAVTWERQRARSIRIVERPTREALACLSTHDLRTLGYDVLAILRERAGIDA